MGVELNNDQLFACNKLEHWWHSASSDQVIGLGGGAGTGKTTTILYLVQRIGLTLDQVLFVSYMGKAVSRMIQTGLPAKTIHATCYTYEKQIARDDDGHMIFTASGKPKMNWVPILKDHLPKKIKLIIADEAYTIPEKNAIDLESFGIPIIAVGDENQLDPPFGKPYFLANGPDIKLTQIMRQAEGNPIIWLANQVLKREYIRDGQYGTSSVIRKQNLTDFSLRNADVILTSTNRLRGSINKLFREQFMNFTNMEIPHVGEKLLCVANDWSRFINMGGGEIYLTNGTTGIVDYVDKRSLNSKSIKLDFLPDYGKRAFHNIQIDLDRLNAPLGQHGDAWTPPDMNSFEYGYALTIYKSQGSDWANVLILDEGAVAGVDKYYRSLYTALTRATQSVTLVR
jgi:exodeoxyribonuclease-5